MSMEYLSIWPDTVEIGDREAGWQKRRRVEYYQD